MRSKALAHRQFLDICVGRKLIPVSLRFLKPLVVNLEQVDARYATWLTTKWPQVQNNCSRQLVCLLRDFYRKSCMRPNDDIEERTYRCCCVRKVKKLRKLYVNINLEEFMPTNTRRNRRIPKFNAKHIKHRRELVITDSASKFIESSDDVTLKKNRVTYS
ncbi:hypothetical protein GJ496_001479 [Pomphorhynchus laevis]|nr:hypothetical protein GJ496_001479 [Pomphorhynchus laevis]